MRQFVASIFWAFGLGLLTVQGAFASSDPVATVIEINPRTFAYDVDGERRTLNLEDLLYSGERVTTNRKGYAFLEFADSTEITVGPNSKFEIDEVVMANSRRASKFVVSTVTGSFRFVSGKSAKRTYKIKTPTAVLGIRGTDFIIRISRGGGTTVEVEDGNVNFCDTSGCVEVPRGKKAEQECRGRKCTTTVTENENRGQGLGLGRGNSNAGGNGNGNSGNSNAGGNGNGNSGNSNSSGNGNSGNSNGNSGNSNNSSSNSSGSSGSGNSGNSGSSGNSGNSSSNGNSGNSNGGGNGNGKGKNG